jgi:hypothetical protein
VRRFNGYEYGKATNSLLYLYNADTGKANWQPMTKSRFVDERLPGENPKDAADLNEYPLFSKYNSGFTMQPSTENLATPTIAFLEDRIEGNKRYLKIKLPQIEP